MNVYIKTYGCTLNQADTEIMRSILQDNQIKLSENIQESDTVILNTCTVKKPTEQKILHEINKLKSNKNLIITGCMASANADIIKKHAPNAAILTTSNLHHIAEAVNEVTAGISPIYDGRSRIDKLAFLKPSDSILAKIPVSDGCLSACNFCETKYARGSLNSFSEDLILKAIRGSIERGAREIQITSQDIGAYGADRNTDIAKLMEKILSIEGEFMVRIGMLNPEHLHKYLDHFIEVIRNERFYKFVHIPIQSGSDKVLAEMGRRYNINQIKEYISKIRDAIPGVTIETDIIVGYPTENDSDFKSTLDFIKEIKPEVTNISKFSVRHQAKASKLKELDNSLVKKRSVMLSRVVRSVQHEINDSFIGKRLNVILTENTDQSVNGRTDSYKQVVIRLPDLNNNAKIGRSVSVGIHSASANVLYGKI